MRHTEIISIALILFLFIILATFLSNLSSLHAQSTPQSGFLSFQSSSSTSSQNAGDQSACDALGGTIDQSTGDCCYTPPGGSYTCTPISTSSSSSASTPTDWCNMIFGQNSNQADPTVLSTLGLSTSISTTAISVSLLALIVSFDVIGLAYVIGRIFPTTNVRNWLGREYWEVTKSAILIAALFSILAIASGFGVLLTGGSAGSYSSNIQNLLGSSESYLCTVNNQANYAIANIFPSILGISALKSIVISYPGFPVPPVPLPGLADLAEVVFRSGITFNPFSNFLYGVEFVYLGQNLSFFIDFILYLIIPVKVFFSTQIIILPGLMTLGLVVLIPTGLVMRALPFIRGIGGTLIAFGIGLAIIWPTLLVLLNAPISSYFCGVLSPNFCNTNVGPTAITCPPGETLTNDVCTSTALAASSVCPSLTTAGGLFSIPCQAIINWLSGLAPNLFAIPLGSVDSIYPIFNLFLQYGMYLIIQLYILVIIDFMIVYALTDAVARMLGGTIRLSLGNKLRLV